MVGYNCGKGAVCNFSKSKPLRLIKYYFLHGFMDLFLFIVLKSLFLLSTTLYALVMLIFVDELYFLRKIYLSA